MREGHRGDLVVEIRLVLPTVLDERSKELLREFGQLQSDDVRAALRRDPSDG
jgi:molecular chaperone DnaJ